MARITPASAKAKGRILQQWVCERVSNLIKLPWGHDQPIESRPMGQAGVDVRLDREALDLFPWSVECKWQESWAVPAWIEQARKNLVKDTNWLLFMKRSRKKPVVVLEATVFFDILEQLYKEVL